MRGSVLALACCREHSAAEERAYQDEASEVDTQSPPGLCITAGPNPMEGRERKDAKCQHMYPPPPGVANARAQPGADADSDPEVQSYYAECHPFRTIMTCKWNEDFVPSEVGERIYPHRQDMYDEKDCAQQRQKVMQFAIEQARPAAWRL